jgi:hypothetical protein
MAGTLIIDTLKSSTTNPPVIKNSSGTEVGTYCRAWVNFNGTGGTIKAAFNVGSVTKNATGDYTINFTNALPDTNYSAVSMPISYTTSLWYATSMMIMGNAQGGGGATTKTTTQLRLMTGLGSNAGAFDHGDVNIAIFR